MKGKEMQESLDVKMQPRIHVLILASDTPRLRFFTLGLKYTEYITASAHYDVENLSIVRNVNPHLILLAIDHIHQEDVMYIHQLRKEVIHPCPLVVVAEQQNKSIAQAIGIDAFIVSPCGFDEVLNIINSYISHLVLQKTHTRKGFLFRIDNPASDLFQ